MKRFIKTAMTVVLAAAAVSCAKELEPQKGNINGTIDLSFIGAINGYTPQDETKAEAQTVVRIMWKGDETVYVYDGTKNLGSLTASIEGTDGTYAKLSGTIRETTATTLTFVYSPQFDAAPPVTDGKISLGLSTQNDEEVPFLIYATLPTAQTQDPTSFTNDVVQFNLATSVFKCNCTGLGEDGDISKAEISGVNTKCDLTLSDNGAPEVSGSTPGTITRTAGFTKADQRAIFSVALPETAASTERNILVHQNSKVFGAPFSAIAFAVNKSYNTVYELGEYVAPPAGMLPGVFSVADGKTVHFSKGNLYYDGSKFNFEANQYDSTPSSGNDWSADHISHFCWSKDPNEAIKEEYNWYQEVSDEDVFFTNADDFTVNVGDKEQGGWRTLSTTEWNYLFAWDPTLNFYAGDFNAESPRYGLFKCSVTVCGNTNCVVLLPDDWKWGENGVGDTWQLVSEVTEYSEETTITWSTMEAAGAVCLPAAGYRDVSDVWYVGDIGYYWSSSADCSVYFNSSKVNPNSGGDRYDSYSVRLITEASDGYAPKAPEVPVEGISLSETELELIEGGSKSLTVTFTPEDATKKDVFWSSDNTAVVTVDQTGKVSAVSTGTATITAVAGGLVKATCEVTVSKLPKYVIIYKAAEKLIEYDPNDEEQTPGIHTDAFGDNTIKSHEFENGVGTITFNDEVTSIGQLAFYECGITYVGIPASVKEIGMGAFACEALEQVFIADGSELETIGGDAFWQSAIKSFNIPASVMSIEGAFSECGNLTTVTFADNSSLDTIGIGAFYYCTKLTSVNIPASVTVFCLNAFRACKDLEAV